MSLPWLFPASPTPPDFSVDWDRIDPPCPWLEGLRGCPQNPVFHAEGDVLIHTRMVAEALARDPDWQALHPTERGILFAAALLHDVGKPPNTEVRDGRITAPGHARKGAKMAQEILYTDWPGRPIPLDVRQKIVGLVRYHGLPLWFLDRPDIRRTVIASSLHAPNAHIAMLARADVLGRICEDTQDLLERVDLFHEYSAEMSCLDAPYAFPSEHTRFVFFRSDGRSPQVEAYDDTTCEVVMMSGLPGAGKDTWIGENLAGWPVVSLDSIRQEMDISPAEHQGPVANRAQETARGYLRDGISFGWNATDVTQQLRRGLVDLFTGYKARVRIVYLEAPWPELVRRNETRARPVPAAVLERLARNLEVPDLSEAQRVEWVET